MTNIKLISAQCHRYTFQPTKIRKEVIALCSGTVLNLFAGLTILDVDEYRVDSDSDMPRLNYIGNAEQFLSEYKHIKKFDTIIFDPPWNARKAREKYEGRYIGKFTKLKEDIVNLLHPGGCIISVGYKISYFGKKRGFEISDLIIVNPGGDINPFFIVKEVSV